MVNFDKPHSQESTCPICERPSFPKFSVPCDYRKPDNSQKYEVYWCLHCDYGQVWNRPSKMEVASFYILDRYYTHESQPITIEEEKLSYLNRLMLYIAWRLDRSQDLNPQYFSSLLNRKNSTICEIGCGHGKKLAKFQAAGFSIFGVEPDPASREIAKKVTVNIFEGTAEELPEKISIQQYDIVLMSHVLEHCLDINTAVSNANKILKEGGIFIVETPNCQSIAFKKYQGNWPWSDIPRHLNFFTPKSLSQILKKHGFEIQQTQYRGFCRQFSSSWFKKEEEVWTAFSKYSLQKQQPPNFSFRVWKVLLSSLFASPESKYDSVRFIAVKARA